MKEISCITVLICVLCVFVISDRAKAENVILPPKIESVATTEQKEIVTGVCNFGGCHVETTTAPTTTEPPTTAPPTTEPPTTEPPTTEPPATEKRQYDHIGTFYVTGYTAEEGFPEGSATSSGYGVRSGYCAMNDEQRRSLGIRYGDYIYVSGLGTYKVMDCGCGWGVVDIWVYTNAEAYNLTGYREVYRYD